MLFRFIGSRRGIDAGGIGVAVRGHGSDEEEEVLPSGARRLEPHANGEQARRQPDGIAVIAFALRQAESGTPVAEIIRRLGVSEQTFYRWKKQFAGLGVAELRRLRTLEEENRKLKQLVADLSLDKKMLQDVLSKKL